MPLSLYIHVSLLILIYPWVQVPRCPASTCPHCRARRRPAVLRARVATVLQPGSGSCCVVARPGPLCPGRCRVAARSGLLPSCGPTRIAAVLWPGPGRCLVAAVLRPSPDRCRVAVRCHVAARVSGAAVTVHAAQYPASIIGIMRCHSRTMIQRWGHVQRFNDPT